jgi:hypothetical protein
MASRGRHGRRPPALGVILPLFAAVAVGGLLMAGLAVLSGRAGAAAVLALTLIAVACARVR